MKVHPTINVSQLKPYHRSQPAAFPHRLVAQPPPLRVFETDDKEHEVEEISGHRMHRGSAKAILHGEKF